MKFITSLKFLVLLIITLSVFTKKVTRSTTASTVLTKLDAMAEAKSYCYSGGQKKIDSRWLEINTSSANSGKSGLILRNYYKNQSFDCPNLKRISDSNNRKQYFVSFRKFSAYNGAYGKENNFYQMRQLMINMVNSSLIIMNIDKKVFSDDINEKELKKMVRNLTNNQNFYMTKFRKYRNELIDIKTKANTLKNTQLKRISTKEQLQSEIHKKGDEIIATIKKLKTMKDKAQAHEVQIREFEREINVKRTDILDPAMQQLKETMQSFDAYIAQKADNDKKINGIVPIDSNDLVKSNNDLRAKLVDLQKLYIISDPKSKEIGKLIKHLDTKIDTIPTVIA